MGGLGKARLRTADPRQRVHAAAVIRIAVGADYQPNIGGVAAQHFAHMAEHIFFAPPGDIDHTQGTCLLGWVLLDVKWTPKSRQRFKL